MNKSLNTESKNNYILIGVVVAIILVIVGYTNYIRKGIENYAAQSVEQNAKKISEEVDEYIESAINSIQLTSHLVTKTMTEDSIEDAGKIIEPMLNNTPFNFIEYIDSNGINKTDKGAEFDASDRVYYQNGIKGITGVWINYTPKYAEEYLLNFYTPLYYDNNISGVITGTLGSKTDILPILQTSFYGENMIGILCDVDGKVISTTLNVNKTIYLEDIINGFGMSDEDKQYFEVGDEGKVFEFCGSKGKAIAYISTNKQTGWRVIQIVPPVSFKAVMRNNTSGAYIAVAVICEILLLYLLYLRMQYIRRQKELIKEKDKVVQDYGQILTATASDNYKSIRRVDLETGQADMIYFENGRVQHSELGDWETWLAGQQKYIHKDDWKKVTDFLMWDRINEMANDVTYKISFRSAAKNEKGYFRIYSTTASVIFQNEKRIALMTTIDSTEAALNEIEQKMLLVSAASIYISMHVIDLKKDTMVPLSSEIHIDDIIAGRRSGVSEIIKDVMTKLTDEQHIDMMMEFIDFSTLDERMKGANTITMEFMGSVSGWCRARFIAVEYDENMLLSRVLFVVENIDAEKKKSNQLLYLSETDLMTGIRNRGSGERKIKELIAKDREGMFALLDADKFKSVNDNYGHAVGDKVIIEIANCLKSSFRDSDVVMRLGGDEYAVFANGLVNEEQAEIAIQRFFSAINNMYIPELGDRKISVSMGVAFKKQGDGMDFEQLYHNADSGTYKSKKIEGNAYTIFKND